MDVIARPALTIANLATISVHTSIPPHHILPQHSRNSSSNMASNDSVPESLKSDRNVAPYIARATELATVNPVVSYYCKIYVLDHILSNKLHLTSPEVELFTVALLDDTESIKNSSENEEVAAIVADRQLSVNLVFAFAFRLFTSGLEDLLHYDGSNKIQLASKLRATINFLSVLKVFYGGDDDSIDFSKTSGGKCATRTEFESFIKDKIKTVKYQLSRLIKDEIPLQGEEEELAALEQLPVTDLGADSAAEEQESSPFPDAPSELKDLDSPADTHSPSSPKLSSSPGDENPFSLPGAPKFDPASENSDNGDSDVKLPGAPKFLPDDDISHINKKSSIQVFPPDSAPKTTSLPPKPVTSRKASTTDSHPHKPITKESLADIIDTTEQIAQIQKHAKFAISALNYEDLETAQKELTRSLEILNLVKKHANA